MNRVEPNRNVYVGHRYVPLLVGEWDKSIQYEGLSIVTFKGASYTSKKMTPVGIDIENEEYWVLTGNYNAQIEYYRQDVERLEQDVNDRVEKFEQDVNDQVETLEQDVTNQVESLEQNVNNQIDNVNNSLDGKINKNAFYVDVLNFGAVGDGETDDTSALNNAIDYILLNGGIFFIPQGYVCHFKGDLNMLGVRNVQIEGELKGDTINDVILGLSSINPAPTNYIINRAIETTLNFRGIKNAHGTIRYAQHLKYYADGNQSDISSIAYNQITLGKIDMFEIDSVNGGWINENKFFGGRIRDLTINSSDDSYRHNHNIFYAPNLEGSTVIFDNSHNNIIYDARLEGSNEIKFGSRSSANLIEKSWTSEKSAYLQGQEKSIVDNYVTDNGDYNRVVHVYDKYTTKHNIFNLSSDTGNYNISHFENNGHQLKSLFEGVYDPVFDTGIIDFLDNFGFELNSDIDLWWVSVELYDENKSIIDDSTIMDDTLDSTTMSQSTQTPSVFNANRTNKNLRFSANKNDTVKYIRVSVTPRVRDTNFSYLNLYLRKEIDSDQELPVHEKFSKNTTNSYETTSIEEIGTVAYHTNPTTHIGIIMTSEGWKNFGSIT